MAGLSGWLGSTGGSPQTAGNWGFAAPGPSHLAVRLNQLSS
jgi:hypothetical protein